MSEAKKHHTKKRHGKKKPQYCDSTEEIADTICSLIRMIRVNKEVPMKTEMTRKKGGISSKDECKLLDEVAEAIVHLWKEHKVFGSCHYNQVITYVVVTKHSNILPTNLRHRVLSKLWFGNIDCIMGSAIESCYCFFYDKCSLSIDDFMSKKDSLIRGQSSMEKVVYEFFKVDCMHKMQQLGVQLCEVKQTDKKSDLMLSHFFRMLLPQTCRLYRDVIADALSNDCIFQGVQHGDRLSNQIQKQARNLLDGWNPRNGGPEDIRSYYERAGDFYAWCVDVNGIVQYDVQSNVWKDHFYWTDKIIRQPWDELKQEVAKDCYNQVVLEWMEENKHMTFEQQLDTLRNNRNNRRLSYIRCCVVKKHIPSMDIRIGSLGFKQEDSSVFWIVG